MLVMSAHDRRGLENGVLDFVSTALHLTETRVLGYDGHSFVLGSPSFSLSLVQMSLISQFYGLFEEVNTVE